MIHQEKLLTKQECQDIINYSESLDYWERRESPKGNEVKYKYFVMDISNFELIGDKFLNYKSDTSFKFSLNEYPDEFDFDLIEKYGWYSPSNSKKPNIGGVSRDHMLSVKEGFKFGIDPKLLAHPANCQLMVHSDNISKNKKSSLTLDELMVRIDEWVLKYKND